MRIESVNKISRQDIPEAPAWIDKVLSPLNQFMDSVSTAMRGKVTFYDNLYCVTKEFEFTHAVEQKISHTLKSYSGLIVIKGPDSSDDNLRLVSPPKVRTIDNQTLGITFYFGGGATYGGTVRFLILG